MSDDQKICFVVMPFGRSPQEQRWFQGWYKMVIETAVTDAGFSPFLSASQEKPEAINDEIRYQLATAPMVLVDLGGMLPQDPPNPNVMYELGIRHAFGLPLVLLAWEGQSLPFDISNQRAIMCSRDMLDILPTRRRIQSFLLAAQEGRFYNPMEAVSRRAQLNEASNGMSEDAVLRTLIAEIEDLKMSSNKGNLPVRVVMGVEVRHFLTGELRFSVRNIAKERGMTEGFWSRIMNLEVPHELRGDARYWDSSAWVEYLFREASKLSISVFSTPTATGSDEQPLFPPDQDFLDRVATLLPQQPWPKNIHKEIATSLEVSRRKVQQAINQLIRQGKFLPQIEGVLYRPEPCTAQEANKSPS